MQGAQPGRCQLDFRANALRRLAFARETGAPAADLAQTDHIGAGAAPVFVFEL